MLTRPHVCALLLLATLITSKAFAQSAAYNFYYGNLHAHSAYSDGNQDSATSGHMRPRQDYAFADASLHMDFLGISEHNHGGAGMKRPYYARGLREADSATTNGSFIALYGMEWGIIANGGHMLVYGVNQLLGWEPGNYDVFVGQQDYTGLFRQINRRPGAFALFAHPQSGDYNGLARVDTAFRPVADSALVGTPMRSGPASSTAIDYSDASNGSYESTYIRMLSKGYHMGISLDHDNHKTTFGRTTPGRLVVLADSLTRPKLLAALRTRRFYASDDWNAELSLTINGQPMGSILESANPVNLSITFADGDLEPAQSITLMRGVPGSGANATIVATAASGTAMLTYTDTMAIGAQRYYYAIVMQADGDRIVSSPIWYKRINPSAIAVPLPLCRLELFPNPAQGGGAVTLSYFMARSEPVSLTVYNALGRQVARPLYNAYPSYGAQGVQLETASLPPGVYTVRLQQGQQVAHKPLLVE